MTEFLVPLGDLVGEKDDKVLASLDNCKRLSSYLSPCIPLRIAEMPLALVLPALPDEGSCSRDLVSVGSRSSSSSEDDE